MTCVIALKLSSSDCVSLGLFAPSVDLLIVWWHFQSAVFEEISMHWILLFEYRRLQYVLLKVSDPQIYPPLHQSQICRLTVGESDFTEIGGF